ncbi:unnamed protein product [Diamesa hyperborea]
MSKPIIFYSFIGMCISAYTIYVKVQSEMDPKYEAMCDINPKVSCTKVFNSEYGRGFGLIPKDSPLNLPNGLFGIVHYFIIALLGFFDSIKLVKLQFGLVILSNLLSVYLAYVLYFILQDLCLVCVATYIFNIVSLVFVWKKLAMLKEKESHIKMY